MSIGKDYGPGSDAHRFTVEGSSPLRPAWADAVKLPQRNLSDQDKKAAIQAVASKISNIPSAFDFREGMVDGAILMKDQDLQVFASRTREEIATEDDVRVDPGNNAVGKAVAKVIPVMLRDESVSLDFRWGFVSRIYELAAGKSADTKQRLEGKGVKGQDTLAYIKAADESAIVLQAALEYYLRIPNGPIEEGPEYKDRLQSGINAVVGGSNRPITHLIDARDDFEWHTDQMVYLNAKEAEVEGLGNHRREVFDRQAIKQMQSGDNGLSAPTQGSLARHSRIGKLPY